MAADRKPDDERWSEFLQLLMTSLDVQDYLESKGVKFTGGFNDRGWAECHAVDRPDTNPSAAVNLGSGYYKDLGGGPSYPFFHLLVHLGVYPAFQNAVEGVATDLKLKSRMPKSRKGLSFWSKLKFTKAWNSLACRKLLSELSIDEDVLTMVGSKMANTASGDMAVCMPVFCPSELFEGSQVGFVLKNAYGGTLLHDKGKGAAKERLNNKSLGTGGMLNKHTFEVWETAGTVFKVEGISDMLTLQHHIPVEVRDKYVVTTNSDGCDASQTPWSFSHHCDGKNVVIIHDADEPGQFGDNTDKRGGAQRWIDCALAGGCKSAVNLQLPYEIAPKKGKDLRDWFDDGGTWEKLLELVEGSESHSPEELKPENDLSGLKPHQQILRDLNLMVIGHRKNSGVEVFNAETMRRFSIPDIDRFSYNRMLIHIGEKAKTKIHCAFDGDCPAEQFTDVEVRRAIAEEAGGKEISRANTIGVGIWEFSGRLVAVGAGEWLAVNGGVESFQTPTVEGKIVDFGEQEESWYDRELLEKYMKLAKSPAWRTEHFNRLVEIFGLWGNHKHPLAEVLLSSLCLCSWVQQVWNLRPWIGIQGESSSGKTVLMEFLSRYFGTLAIANSNVSEAGLRAAVRNSSRVLLLDEFEDSKERSKIVALLMGSSRKGSMGGNLRATSGQEAVKGGIQAIPWMSAVELKADKQTERNRYLMVEMGSRKGLPWFTIPEDEEEYSELRNKSIAIVMVVWKRAMELCDILTKSTKSDYTRVAESYATACAMYSAVSGHDVDTAVDFYQSLLRTVSDSVDDAEETEQMMVLDAILNSTVQTDGGQRRSIGELLKQECGTEDTLNRFGIRRVSSGEVESMKDWQKCEDRSEESHVFIDTSANAQVRRSVLRDTEYASKNLRTVLSRLPSSVRTKCRVASASNRGVLIPRSVIGSVDIKEFCPAGVDSDLKVAFRATTGS